MKGIDVSYAQGEIDWEAVRADGVEFAMIKASQGKLLRDPSVGPFTDPFFARNMAGAASVGIPVGVYHYLCAGTLSEARAEAQYFLSVIAPFREQITLWAACDAEEDRYLPSNSLRLRNVVHQFLHRVHIAGYRRMLYTNPNYLQYRFIRPMQYDLWLAYWGTTEARALSYCPKIWQYGVGQVGGMGRVDCNRGYFRLE